MSEDQVNELRRELEQWKLVAQTMEAKRDHFRDERDELRRQVALLDATLFEEKLLRVAYRGALDVLASRARRSGGNGGPAVIALPADVFDQAMSVLDRGGEP